MSMTKGAAVAAPSASQILDNYPKSAALTAAQGELRQMLQLGQERVQRGEVSNVSAVMTSESIPAPFLSPSETLFASGVMAANKARRVRRRAIERGLLPGGLAPHSDQDLGQPPEEDN
jgi:hypothetical protein